MTSERFSRRHGLGDEAVEITVRYDAPRSLRHAVISIVYQRCDKGPRWLREIVCDVLLVRPDQYNWTEFPNIEREVQQLIEDCKWYTVYDIIEAIDESLKDVLRAPYEPTDFDQPTEFAAELNRYFVANGIGWKLVDGHIEARGDDAFERSLLTAQASLRAKGLATSHSELREAVRSLSARPDPDVTGTIQHAMAALECVAREVTDDQKSTLGAILKGNPGIIPKPLDASIEKAWGFASEQGRHLREGRTPSYEEAELVVGVSAAVCTYLSHKFQ